MRISGVVVHARPERAELVATKLSRLPGVEIHARLENGRFVVTVEEENDGPISTTLITLRDIEGVLSAAMVYQHCEDEEMLTA